jgi:hypothetical protein
MAEMNADGLYLKFGTEKGQPTDGGAYVTTGALREVEITIDDMTTLTTTHAIHSDAIRIPRGVRIQEIEVITETVATTSTSAALDVGLVRDDRTTAIDVDGLVDALAVTSMDGAGETTLIQGPASAPAGALVGTTLANSGYIVVGTSTGTFTAGKVVVKIRFYTPDPA